MKRFTVLPLHRLSIRSIGHDKLSKERASDPKAERPRVAIPDLGDGLSSLSVKSLPVG